MAKIKLVIIYVINDAKKYHHKARLLAF